MKNRPKILTGARTHSTPTRIVGRSLKPTVRSATKMRSRKAAFDEEAAIARVVARSQAALAAGVDVILPAEIAEAIARGESPLRVVRNWRGLTQVDLGKFAAIDQGTISDMERSGGGNVANWRKVATALRVPLDLIVPED